MITIETWAKGGTFIRHDNKRVDPWFARYVQGKEQPRYQMPAIPLQVVWPDRMKHIGYADMIYIDDVSDPDDPVMVCAWDFHDGPNRIGKHGEYTRT